MPLCTPLIWVKCLDLGYYVYVYVVHTDEIGDQALASTQVFPGVVGPLAWTEEIFEMAAAE